MKTFSLTLLALCLLFPAYVSTQGPGTSNATHKQATVTFYRTPESGMYPKTKTMIFANKLPLAEIGNGRFFTATLPAGTYTFTARDKKEPGIEMVLEVGKVYYINAVMDLAHLRFMRKPNFRLMIMSAEQGVADTKTLSPIPRDGIRDPQAISIGHQ